MQIGADAFVRQESAPPAGEFEDAQIQEVEEDEQHENKVDHEVYWRERLEKRMESLTVNILVMSLVLVDITSIIIFSLVIPVPEDAPDPVEQITLTVFVLSCFVVELTLRQVAQRHRYHPGGCSDVAVANLRPGFLSTCASVCQPADSAQPSPAADSGRTTGTSSTSWSSGRR